MKLSLLDVVSFTAIFLFWLLTAFLISIRAGRRAGNWLLASFLTSKGICYLAGLFLRFGCTMPGWPEAYSVGIAFEFVLGPSLYLYTLSLVAPGYVLRRSHLLHLLPFGIYLACVLAVMHVQGALPFRRGWAEQALDTAIFAQCLVYVLLATRLFFRHRRRVRDFYSVLEERRLAWLGSLLFYFLGIWLAGFANVSWYNLRGSPLIPGFVFDLLLLSFATMIVFFGLHQPELFSGSEAPAEEPRKDARPRLAASDRDRLLARVSRAMQTERPYLNPDVTLADLSVCSGVPARDLTYLLRESLDTCFYEYINRHRIDEAKRLLGEEVAGSIVEVMQRAGFNSKSVFNTAFKKHTGMTPTEFRKRSGRRRLAGPENAACSEERADSTSAPA